MNANKRQPYLSLKTGVRIGLILMAISLALVEKTYVSDGWLVTSKKIFGLMPYSTARIAELNQVTNVIVRCDTGSAGDATVIEYYLYLETLNKGAVLLPTSTFASTSSNKAEQLRAYLQESLPHSNTYRWAFIMWPLGCVGAFIFLISGFLLLVKR